MKKLILSMAMVALTVFGLGSVAMISPVYADGLQDGLGQIEGEFTATGPDGLWDMINTVINVILGLVGVVAVFMLILGGINFITSQGDTAKVTKARNTILYGAIGLVVALLAYAIVNFVVSKIVGGE